MGLLSMFPTSCSQEMCSKYEAVDEDPVGKFIISGSPDHFQIKFVISHNSRGCDAQFLLRSFLELRWVPQLIIEGSKILSICVEKLNFLDLLNFMPMSLKSMPKSFELTCKKRYYPHFFNTAKN